jgi:ubiquinol-cytochrome c reductase cytochrome b subunit
MKGFFDWLDHRTGCRALAREALYENIPGGSRWRYVWGSTLTFGLAVQIITGIFLWMAYSPSSHTAWESVYYIQDVMHGGWLLRGLHHYTAHAMTILLVLHLMQVVIDGAYKAPREVNFWFGLALLLLVLGLSLTGYLLPWDQKGYWASKVATNLAGIVPLVGTPLQRVIIGGPDYGHATLTRFFALHAGVLPATVIALVVAHIYLFRRHGIKAREPLRRPDTAFWPDQWLKDAVACLAVLAAVLFFIVRHRLFSDGPLGAELGPPADPSEPYSAARPDWYFLSLFQFLKYFPGRSEIWGAIVIPGVVVLLVALMPFIGRWKLGHRFNVGFLVALIVGSIFLTFLALAQDRQDSNYQQAVRESAFEADRVRELASSPAGIPVEGATALLHNDPLTQGPKLFAQKCAVCHRYGGGDALGAIPARPQSASDLKGFASRTWLAGSLDPNRIATTNYFGATKFHDGKMARFVKKDVAAFSPEQKQDLEKVIAALSAEAGLKAQSADDQSEGAMIEAGRVLIQSDAMRCTECHSFHKPTEDAIGPNLTGYGSREWLIRFIGNPAHADFYGDRNDRMPAFGEKHILSPQEIGLIADWLRGEWFDSSRAIQ